MVSSQVLNTQAGRDWTLYNGDCCDVVAQMPDNTIDLCIHSPPFSNLYIYSDSEADMGNSATDEEFFAHYEYLIPELHRVTVPGRLCVVHCKDLPKYANRDDTAGLKDFPGDIIRAFESHGWSYHSRVTIWKCPVTERERTNNNGLLHKTAERDRSQLRQGMADFLIVLRKPPAGTLMSDKPVTNGEGVLPFNEYIGQHPLNSPLHPSKFARTNASMHASGQSIDIWRRYAEPVWWDVDQTNVLNYRRARSEHDERHICPLQLDLIERCIQLWSNPGDVVLSPFAGIGSEGVGALRMGRKFIGVELKPEYFHVATQELTRAERQAAEGSRSLFAEVDA